MNQKDGCSWWGRGVLAFWVAGQRGHGGTTSGEFLGRLQEVEAAASSVAKI